MTPKFKMHIGSESLIPQEGHAEPFRRHLARLGDGTEVYVTVKKITKRGIRSLNQNNYYWGVVIEILSDHTGYLPEEMHEALKQKFLSYENFPGLRANLTTASLKTHQFEIYLSKIRRWASTDLGVFIPEPNEVDYE